MSDIDLTEAEVEALRWICAERPAASLIYKRGCRWAAESLDSKGLITDELSGGAFRFKGTPTGRALVESLSLVEITDENWPAINREREATAPRPEMSEDLSALVERLEGER